MVQKGAVDKSADKVPEEQVKEEIVLRLRRKVVQ